MPGSVHTAMAGLRAWLGKSGLRAAHLRTARRTKGAPSGFLCLPDDIDFQIMLEELHYPPISHFCAVSLQKRSLQKRALKRERAFLSAAKEVTAHVELYQGHKTDVPQH